MPGAVAWFTGLSGSGKSAIAERVAEILRAQGRSVRILDGDAVRSLTNRHLGFSPEDIRENNRLIALLCQESIPEFDVVLVPIISPFRDSRNSARCILGDAFAEVYIKASLPEVMKRDPKGLYKAVREGKLTGFVGVDSKVPYEPPESADLVLDTEQFGLEECSTRLAGMLLGEAVAS